MPDELRLTNMGLMIEEIDDKLVRLTNMGLMIEEIDYIPSANIIRSIPDSLFSGTMFRDTLFAGKLNK
jgi:hypothetical protein